VSAPPRSPHTGRLARLADVAFRRRRLVLLGWIAALATTAAISAAFAGAWTADYGTPGSESKTAEELLASRFPQRSPDTLDVVWRAKAGAATPAVRARMDAFLQRAAALPGIGDAPSTRGAIVSRDGTVAAVRVPLTQRPPDVPKTSGKRIIAMADAAGGGLQVEVGGRVIENAEQGPISSEAVGLAIATLVLLLTFGSVVAAGLPLATALFGLGISSGLVGLLAAVIDTPDWASSVAAMIGIGVGVDYSLLILTRFRAALSGGLEPREAAIEAVATAGRSALIAGTTVVISLLGLFLMGLPYLYGVALSAILAVLVVMAAAVTLLPALLGFAQRRVDTLRVPFTGRTPAVPDRNAAARWSRFVQRRPWSAAVAGAIVLLALSAPVTGLHLGFPDAGNDRADTHARQAYDLMSRGFGAGANGPLLLVASVPGGEQATVGRVAAAVSRDPGVAAVARPAFNAARDTAVLTVTPTTSPQSTRTEDLIHRVRDDVVPAAVAGTGVHVDVGGATAQQVDQSAATASRLPLFIGGVVGLSLLLLLVAFRSAVVPLKAGLMNLLSIGAAYGVVAVLADGGWAGQLVGIDTPTPVPPFIPVMMFAILFGLSMDYEVFLLSRVREEYLSRGDTGRAVTEGLARTARVITAAAAIMVAVFGAFALADEVFLKLIGLGLATAILVDATVVRMVLVPAVMQLLGDRNWWLPRWLDRLLPEADIEGLQPSRA
jgi:RND superfamily putative drug exporter